MRVTFISDYISIHQIALCNAFYKLLGEKFTFIATTKIRQARLDMGWYDFTKDVPYAVHSDDYSSADLKNMLNQADVIIVGSSHAKGIDKILRKKITFYYQERPLKNGITELKNPRRFYGILRMLLKQSRRTHLLAASAFSAMDYEKLHCFKNRAWRWGYFIEPISCSYELRNNTCPKILWVGRLIDWKHAGMAVVAAEEMARLGYKIDVDIIGEGPELSSLKEYINKAGLSENIHMLGNMKNEQVRKLMQKADIFLFTSDKREGWGVVLNEAMSAGCCVIASDAIGSAPYLIEDGENGLLFESENQEALNAKLLKVVCNPDICRQMGEKALYTMNEVWSPENAAKSFICLCETLIRNRPAAKKCGEKGPCAPAI